MTRRQLQMDCRNLSIWNARKGGMLLPMIAVAHGLSIPRVKAVLKELSSPKSQKAILDRIFEEMRLQGLVTLTPSKRNPRRAVSL